VDDGAASARLIRDNLARAGRTPQARHLPLDATRLPPATEPPFTLTFLDPPYGRALGDQALRAALAGHWLAPGATVAWEEAQPMMPPPGTTLLDRRRYGAAHVTVLKVDG
jgi:16S rRNA (guanine966-N2)-methyltransferase